MRLQRHPPHARSTARESGEIDELRTRTFELHLADDRRNESRALPSQPLELQ